jgi:hypothetical protein
MVIAALAVAGCGSSSSSSTSSAAITKAAFLAKGNALCANNNKQNQLTIAKLGNHPSKAQITSYVTKTFVPGVQSVIDGVRALGAPSGDQATVTNILNLGQTDLNKIKGNPALLLTAKTNPFANFAKIAHPYGLKDCAKNA